MESSSETSSATWHFLGKTMMHFIPSSNHKYADNYIRQNLSLIPSSILCWHLWQLLLFISNFFSSSVEQKYNKGRRWQSVTDKKPASYESWQISHMKNTPLLTRWGSWCVLVVTCWYGDNSVTVMMHYSADVSHNILPRGLVRGKKKKISWWFLLHRIQPLSRNLYACRKKTTFAKDWRPLLWLFDHSIVLEGHHDMLVFLYWTLGRALGSLAKKKKDFSGNPLHYQGLPHLNKREEQHQAAANCLQWKTLTTLTSHQKETAAKPSKCQDIRLTLLNTQSTFQL